MQDKIVIITGAGFSAPAQLPVQDKILKEMVQLPELDFLKMDNGLESKKFMHAYINVAIYLLKEYSNYDVTEIEARYNKLLANFMADERVQEVLKYMETYDEEAQEKEFNLQKKINDTAEMFIIYDNDFYSGLLRIKEELQKALAICDIQISLEDVFTSFDKSMTMRENTSNYTYTQMEDLQHSILRLFIYYFSKRVNQHELSNEDYINVINYLKGRKRPVSIITTNWDVLLERYLEQAGIQYDYRFNSPYVANNMEFTGDQGEENEQCIPYIKVHGSINWFRCLKCGTLEVAPIQECGNFLFDDEKPEQCISCGQVGMGTNVLIRPEIITPTMLKAINIQLYNNLWQNAAYELRQAKEIIFCGYSLPVADFEFRYLLKQNVRGDAKINVVLHSNDNPDGCPERWLKEMMPEKRFRDLFAKNQCSFFYSGFGDYFRTVS